MSVDITIIVCVPTVVYDGNITNNLMKMAEEAGVYEILWPNEPEETKAGELLLPLEIAINDMKQRPEHYKQFDSPNGWGVYTEFLPFLEKLRNACRDHPEGNIEFSW